ncbi:hypothetical protein PoB_007238200 [Plakobranchus ocellatus]|uniref:Uncharacterized protein n=1 Tax=Plakobranchus ocellatus TaxID=259542 RepID=A0AAV4DP51_9GAST|nr:hypothetical protein PoB_007238200 [Plakobranchus ocellatus]
MSAKDELVQMLGNQYQLARPIGNSFTQVMNVIMLQLSKPQFGVNAGQSTYVPWRARSIEKTLRFEFEPSPYRPVIGTGLYQKPATPQLNGRQAMLVRLQHASKS